MSKTNFYEGLDLTYAEIAKLAKKCKPGQIGMFYLSVLTPYQPSTMINKEKQNLSDKNLINAEKNISITKKEITNVINIKIPEWVGNYAPQDSEGYILKDTKFVCVFIGGDINKPNIIGGDF